MHKVVVVGGGASGMMAGIVSASQGNSVTILEKNEKLGKKIYITGKGRCNLTNDVNEREFLENVVSNQKFLYSAIYTFSPEKTIKFFEENGLALKTERGNRVFPLSDKASDVTKCLERCLKKHNVNISFNCDVKEILIEDNKIVGVLLANGEKVLCDSLVIATGGLSYPLTGSTGSGYSFAASLGHKIVQPKPSLCGLELYDDFINNIQGLALKNVKIYAKSNDKIVFEDFGEALFTHFGISGPIVLSCSAIINKYQPKDINLFLDLKPALTEQTLDNRFVRVFSENNCREISSILREFLPKSFIDPFLRKCQIKSNKKCAEITQKERHILVKFLKDFPLRYAGLRPIDEAIVTSGGVSVKDIEPKTMRSKFIENLYFCGEVIDVDGFTGGFNLQIAFSTGYVAGINA